jgi:hypothetical protein
VLGVLELTGPPPVLNPSLGAGTTSSLTFTVSNDTATAGSEGSARKGPLLVESAELTAPAGFAIQSATLVAPRKHDPPTAHVSVDTATTPYTYTVDLDDLDLAPGASISAILSVTASCAAVSGTWALSVQPAPTPHRQGFTVDPSSALAVGVTGACSLSFAADPTNAVVSTDITSEGFTPGGPPVEVEALDAAGDPLGGVEVTLSAQLGAGSLTGTTASTTGASGSSLGLAAFSPLSIGQTGYYTLEATAPAFVSGTSSMFQMTDAATPCTGNCSGSVSSSSVSVAVTVSNPGTGDTLSVGLGGFAYQCPDIFSPTGYYPTVTGAVGVDLWQPDGSLDPTQRSEQVTLTFPVTQPPPLWFFPFYQVCYASTEPFLGGTLASAAQSIPGYANSTYIGLLPFCPLFPTSNEAPCELSSYWWGGSAVVTFLGAPGDFWGSA